MSKPNKFAGKCVDCGGHVPAEAGTLGAKVDGKWTVRHADGACGAEAVEAPVTKVSYAPTAEQAEALRLFLSGESMVIEAGAGTGKTSTLVQLAQAVPDKRLLYVAFNKAIVVEGRGKFPANTTCSTVHALAYKTLAEPLRARLGGARQDGAAQAKILGLSEITVQVADGVRRLSAGYLAGRVMEAVSNFCKTADLAPAKQHFGYIDGIDMPTPDGRRTYANNDEVARQLVRFAEKAWADLQSHTGALKFGHDHYLKIWQLTNPVLDVDVILFDEAQDANPVMAAVVEAQTCQVVYVGDSCQAIYEFTGAVNTLAKLDTAHRVFLTQSFRFGPAVADCANLFLDRLGAELRLTGTPTIASACGLVERDEVVLTRTNALAVKTVLTLLEEGRRPHLVGGADEVVRFAKAARDLQAGIGTEHPELACFADWGQVQDYVENDPAGSELKLLVGLVDEFGVDTIIAGLSRVSPEAQADVIISTAHKAKGREWDTVRIGSDFPVEKEKVGPAELRLMYVAVTRAKLLLDASAIMAAVENDDEDKPETDQAPAGEDALRAQGWRG